MVTQPSMEGSTFSPVTFCDGMLFYFDSEYSTDYSTNLENLTRPTNFTYDSYYGEYDADPDSLTSSGEHSSKRKDNWTSLDVILTVICALGIVGNILNLLILTRQKLLYSMDHLERSSTYGLIGLAVSDLLFCVAVLPSSLIGLDHVTIMERSKVFHLYYRIYGVALINLFMMVSAWLIVMIAVSRLLVVVCPIRTRKRLNGSKTALIVLLIFALSLLLTLPYFLHTTVHDCQTLDGVILAQIRAQWRTEMQQAVAVYIRWVWPVIANFIPLVILGMCNVSLFREMRKAAHQRRISCRGQKLRQTSQKVTLTLIAIVILFCVLVCPAEILKYIDPYESWGKSGHLIAAIANALQTLNFSCNFVLYCVLNPHFRRTIQVLLLRCLRSKAAGNDRESQRTKLTPQASAERTSLTVCDMGIDHSV